MGASALSTACSEPQGTPPGRFLTLADGVTDTYSVGQWGRVHEAKVYSSQHTPSSEGSSSCSFIQSLVTCCLQKHFLSSAKEFQKSF